MASKLSSRHGLIGERRKVTGVQDIGRSPGNNSITRADTSEGRGAMVRSYLVVNLTSLNFLPMMERWLYRDKAMETISQLGPMLHAGLSCASRSSY